MSSSSLNVATDLSWGDVAVANHASSRMVQIHLKTSKCDQYGQGADVIVGLTGVDICPVSAVSQYWRIRGSAQGPFFLDAQVFIWQIRELLQSLGIPARGTVPELVQPLQQL